LLIKYEYSGNIVAVKLDLKRARKE